MVKKFTSFSVTLLYGLETNDDSEYFSVAWACTITGSLVLDICQLITLIKNLFIIFLITYFIWGINPGFLLCEYGDSKQDDCK